MGLSSLHGVLFSNTTSVVDTATNTVVGNVAVGISPYGITYDPSNGWLYVANCNSGTVSIINGATNAVAGAVIAGSYPERIAYDPSNGYLYVANLGSMSVSIISTASTSVTSSGTSMFEFPWVLAFFTILIGILVVVIGWYGLRGHRSPV